MKKFYNVGWYDDYKGLSCNSDDIKEYAIRELRGISIADLKFRIYFDKTQKKLVRYADFGDLFLNIFAVSNNARGLLSNLMDPCGKWLQCEGLDDFYSLFFFDKEYDCMNVAKSEINIITECGWGRVKVIALDKRKMPQLDIFRFKHVCSHTMWSHIVVSDEFVKIYNEHGLTGWLFEEVKIV